MKRRNQNQKFSFPFFAGSPHTPRRKRNCKEIFGFGIATEGSVRGASVIRQNPADFVRNTFELRPIHTAKEKSSVTNWAFFFVCKVRFEAVKAKLPGAGLCFKAGFQIDVSGERKSEARKENPETESLIVSLFNNTQLISHLDQNNL